MPSQPLSLLPFCLLLQPVNNFRTLRSEAHEDLPQVLYEPLQGCDHLLVNWPLQALSYE